MLWLDLARTLALLSLQRVITGAEKKVVGGSTQAKGPHADTSSSSLASSRVLWSGALLYLNLQLPPVE